MKIAVVGGGAAGLMAACRLIDGGAKVTLFERNDRVGRKLAITGKGRCNLTNHCDRKAFFDNIPCNPKFLYSAFSFFSNEDVMRYFEEELSLPLKTERGNRVFPQSDRAGDVVNALRAHLAKGKCRIVCGRVLELRIENGAVKGLTCAGKTYDFDRVLLCTGGMSYPLTGSTGDGYKLARSAGHSIIAPRPSLVPLECFGSVCKLLQGLSLKNVGLSVYDLEKKTIVYTDFGEMLFAHFGVTGPMILSASAHIRDMKPERYELHLDFKPALSEEMLDRRLISDFTKYRNKDFANALSDLLPAKLIPVVIERSGIDKHKKVNEITKQERRSLLQQLKNFTLKVKGYRPIDEAIVTSGGVNVLEVNAKTMESKITKGLYFAGELLDVDAYTGGFNLQIAFSTAALAAEHILSSTVVSEVST